MARFRVRLRGKTIYDLTLAEDRSYIIGRKDDCDIILQAEKGISREHLKLSFSNDIWVVDVISRYGDLFQNGEKTQQIKLRHGSAFAVPPYDFDFLMTSDLVATSSDHSMEEVQSAHNTPHEQGHEIGDRTIVGGAQTTAYIKVVDKDGDAKELVRLEDGESWLAGRDNSCHIQINDQRVSRRQFEIRRSGSHYHIIDLGSVNGTLVNGTPIASAEPVLIKSGDTIAVLTNLFVFELHDLNYEKQLQLVNFSSLGPLQKNSESAMPAAYQYQQNQDIAPYHQGGQNEVGHYYGGGNDVPPSIQTPKAAGGFDFEKNRLKIILGAVALVLVAYLFGGGSKEVPLKTPSTVSLGGPQEAFLKLKPEQKTLIKQRYKDAKNLYMAGKYQLAQDEIVKIREIIADFEDIKDLDRLSKEAIFIQEQQRRQDEIEKAKTDAEEKIQRQTAECRKKINPDFTEQELDECLSSVLQFNPDHPKITELHSLVQSLVAAKQSKEAQKAAYQADVAKLKALYVKAESIHKTVKNPLDVIDAYEKVVNSRLPDPSGFKIRSTRNIASIRAMMNSKTATYQAEADKLYSAGNLKGAILSLRRARQIDPENLDLMPKIERYVNELRKEMMKQYQEGILEESFGNVEGGDAKTGAKEKWRKILELDIPDGEYYKKAYIKLKKYGAL